MSYIVFVLVDALRADHVGPYGGKAGPTPAVDRLAREGVVFERAISQAPSTRPSVASIMTGLYPSQHGLADRWKPDATGTLVVAGLDPSVPTLAELLAGAGYTTAAFLGGNANMKPLFGLIRGFTQHAWQPTTDGTVITADFERFLAEDRPERAFCYLHYMDVHHPLPETIPSRLDAGIDLGSVSESLNDLMGHYAASVRLVDSHLGRALDALERFGLMDEAMIVFTADHGEELGEHGAVLAHGRTLYRELVRVPLIVRMPNGEGAGTRIDQPVQLIDLMPTILDHSGRPPRDTPGRSLLPLLRGLGAVEPQAFSELLRKDRYSQSVTTRAHQLIESFALEEVATSSAADLRPGDSVQVKGEPTAGGSFIATKVSIKADRSAKVRGIVEDVDPGTGTLVVFGLRFRVDGSTEFVGLDGEPFSLVELAAGDKVSASFEVSKGGDHIASKIKRRKTGGKSKLEGVIEEVRGLGAGLRSIVLLGVEIPLGDGVTVSPLREQKGVKRVKADALSRVLAGDFAYRQRELFDTEADPAETTNLARERPEVVSELEAQLATWTASLTSRLRTRSGDVDVDPETLEQLRRMGYVD